MTTSYGFWTDKEVYFKKKNIFLVEFDFNPPDWTWKQGSTHWVRGSKGNPDTKANDHPELSREEYDAMVDMITKVNGTAIYLKSVDLPSFSIALEGDNKKRNTIARDGSIEVAAGVLDWNPINITLTDVLFKPDSTQRFSPISAIQAALYFAIGTTNSQQGASAVMPLMQHAVLGNISIKMLDAEGNLADMWKLNRCWITAMSYGTLSYDDDAVNELTLSIDYINAKYTTYRKNEKGEVVEHWSVR